MRIAVASGKGGTGKTTVATSLALCLAGQGEQTGDTAAPLFLDCDVEAPNAHLFLKPSFEQCRVVGIPIPFVDEKNCTSCGKCAEVCRYHAIAVLGRKTLVFPQLCHGCGLCSLVCPEQAISEVLNEIGALERGGTSSNIDFARGILNVGEPMAVPVIRQLKKWAVPDPGQDVIVDVSPGTSCPVVEGILGADFLLLVTEPTPFGLHDLRHAVEIAQELQIQAGVVINRSGSGGGYEKNVEDFCSEQSLPILLRIPFDRAIAEGIAQGRSLIEIHPEYRERFIEMYQKFWTDLR